MDGEVGDESLGPRVQPLRGCNCYSVFVVASSSPLPPPNSFSCVLHHGPFITHVANLGHILFTVGSEMQGIFFFPEFISEIMSKFLCAQDRAGT